MEKILSLIVLLVLVCGCQAKSQTMTEDENRIIKSAIITKDDTSIQKANLILDSRIKKYHLKSDYAQKLQLLLMAQEYKDALKTTNEVLSFYPDYIEMITEQCVLSKYLLSKIEADTAYDKAILKLRDEYENTDTADKKSNILSSMIIVATLFGDINTSDMYYQEFNTLETTQLEKDTINYIMSSNEADLYMVFGIE